MQRQSVPLKSCFGAFKDAGGSQLGVLHLEIDLNMVTGLRFTHVPNFGYLEFEGAKNIPVL